MLIWNEQRKQTYSKTFLNNYYLNILNKQLSPVQEFFLSNKHMKWRYEVFGNMRDTGLKKRAKTEKGRKLEEAGQ